MKRILSTCVLSLLFVGLSNIVPDTAANVQAQRYDGHSFITADSPLGTAGNLHQYQYGKDSAQESYQPVLIRTPIESTVTLAIENSFSAGLNSPATVGLLVGRVYRMRITDIPGYPGMELYPTLELVDRIYPPKGQELRFPIEIDIPLDDLAMAAGGKYVTRVVYLENPTTAIPAAVNLQGNGSLLDNVMPISHEVGAGIDPLMVATTRGRAVAILRLGSRTPDSFEAADPVFYFHSPTWLGFFSGTDGGRDNWSDTGNGSSGNGGNSHGGSEVWVADEYLFDGGDYGRRTKVGKDWSVTGLTPENTVVHYDTIDGKTVVSPSNQTRIYSPRFGSVRRVEGLILSASRIQTTAANQSLELQKDHSTTQVGFAAQEFTSGYTRATAKPNDMDGKNQPGGLFRQEPIAVQKGRQEPLGFSGRLFQAVLDGADLPLLAEGSQYAQAWFGNEGLKVRINSYPAITSVGRMKAAGVFTVKNENTDAAVTILKTASKETARPGETVEFTLRFDNIGTQPVGNVTVLDSLTGRLELMPDTVESSVATRFVVEENEAGSLILRFEITDPLEPLQFGIVKFQCRIR